MALLVVVLSAATQVIFSAYEGKDLHFHEALIFVVETLTTTGYGEQLPFLSPVTTLWSLFLMATGFVVIVVWLTSILSSWLAERFQTLPPRQAPPRMEHHVIICGAGPVGRFLAEDLEALEVPYILVDQDRNQLERLMRQGLQVMEGDPGQFETLQAARIEACRALVATMDDPEDANTCLVARALRPDLPLLATAEHDANEPYLRAAGASHVISAKRSLGERLGYLATAPLAGELDRLWGSVSDLKVCQVPVLPGSALDSVTLMEARIRERTGATILGMWQHGHFVPAPHAETRLRPGQVLIAAGRPEHLERLKTVSQVHARPLTNPHPETLVLGYGDVGRAAVRVLQSKSIPFRILSLRASEDAKLPWLEGDATDGGALLRAGIREVGRCIVALDDDARSVFATLMARELNPGLRIVARANNIETVPRLYLAGADNVLSVSEVAGAHLTRQVLPRDLRPPALDDLSTREVPVPKGLVGKSLISGQVSSRSGCLVIGIRLPGGEMEANPSPQRMLRQGERLVLFGTEEQFERFHEAFGG